ncbi:MAG: peptidoglycan DD-metalloendopeptidase family protein [Anaerolineales bacterium]
MTEENPEATASENPPDSAAEAAPEAEASMTANMDVPKPTPKRHRVLEAVLKGLTYTLLILVVVLLAFIARDRFKYGQTTVNLPASEEAAAAVGTPTEAPQPVLPADVGLPPLAVDQSVDEKGIPRTALLHTTIPTRPRVDVITYTVQTGDTLFSIADEFGLKPETLLWGNFETLEDNPHLLRPEQVLNILPVDGTYYQWTEGDTLSQVADFFEVDPDMILEYPGNRFDLTLASVDAPAIDPGTWLIVPDGKRAIKDWGPPAISRSNPASASYYGAGHCGSIYEGAVGTSTFVWPTVAHSISGYSYNPGVHPAIDLAGAEGSPVFATDSGVVVYSGWSNYGYGNLVVIDHGNGWQSAYAHLSAAGVVCGQSVFQGGSIGAVGNTGNSYGAHLHFELVYGGAKLNPLDFLP